MGASDQQTQALIKNPWYSLSVLTSLVTALDRLSGVNGRPAVMALAATATTEDQARFLANALEMLAAQQQTGAPLAQVGASGTVIGWTPVAHRSSPQPWIMWPGPNGWRASPGGRICRGPQGASGSPGACRQRPSASSPRSAGRSTRMCCPLATLVTATPTIVGVCTYSDNEGNIEGRLSAC